MWPWSTIRNLRGDLKRADDANIALRKESHDLRVINANLHDALRNANRLAGDLAIQVAELEQRQRSDTEIIEEDVTTIGELHLEIDELRAQLAEAQKNDRRGAKGRFTKASNTETETHV